MHSMGLPPPPNVNAIIRHSTRLPCAASPFIKCNTMLASNTEGVFPSPDIRYVGGIIEKEESEECITPFWDAVRTA